MMSIQRWCLCATVWVLCSAVPPVRADFLIVGGHGSQNLVRFDVATGAASEFGRFRGTEVPRNLAVDSNGTVYASVYQGNSNVVRFVPRPDGGPLVSEDFTSSVGGFGPAQLDFYNGDLYAAGDADDVIHQYDGQTGAEIRTFSASTSFNIRAMTIEGDYLYYAEIFQDRVHRFDLREAPPTGGMLFQDNTNLSEPVNMTVGHNGNLVFTGRDTPLIQEFDIATGAFVGTIADLSTFDATVSGADDITHSANLDSYFVSTGRSIFRFDPAGQLLQTYESPLFSGAGPVLVIVPEPGAGGLALWAVVLAGLSVVTQRACRRRSRAGTLGTATGLVLPEVMLVSAS